MVTQHHWDLGGSLENMVKTLREIASELTKKKENQEWSDILEYFYDSITEHKDSALLDSLRHVAWRIPEINWEEVGCECIEFSKIEKQIVEALAQAAIQCHKPHHDLLRNKAGYEGLSPEGQKNAQVNFERSHQLLLWLNEQIQQKACGCVSSRVGLDLAIGENFFVATYPGYDSAQGIEFFKSALNKPVTSQRYRQVADFLSQLHEKGLMGCVQNADLAYKYSLIACNNRGTEAEAPNIQVIQKLDRFSQDDRTRAASLVGRGQFNITARATQFETKFGRVSDNIQAAVPFLRNPGTRSFASAFLIDDHYLLTNSHCVDDASQVDLYFFTTNDGCVRRSAEVVYHGNEYRDVAVLRIREPIPGVSPLPIRLDRLDPGSHVFGVGNIAGICPAGFFGGDIIGYGSAITQRGFDKLSWMFNSCTYYKGTSGGPVIDEYGNVIGIIARIQHKWCFHFEHDSENHTFDIIQSGCIEDPAELQNYKLAVPIRNAIDAVGINLG